LEKAPRESLKIGAFGGEQRTTPYQKKAPMKKSDAKISRKKKLPKGAFERVKKGFKAAKKKYVSEKTTPRIKP